MAVTKIKPIHSTLKAAIKYITNKDKTNESTLIDSYGCSPETAHLEFKWTADKNNSSSHGKKSVLAYHVIQSFKHDEITPELAHKLGKEFASKITDSKYEYIVSTHVDKNHIHNHIIFNAVSFNTHNKYHSDIKSYYKIRNMSDLLCEEHGLSVIKEPKNKGMSYYEWMNKNEGKSYKQALKSNIDKCISSVSNMDELIVAMTKLGYEVKLGKYIAFKAPDQERFTRLKALGPNYTPDKIIERINNRSDSGFRYKKHPYNMASSTGSYIGLISSLKNTIDTGYSSRCVAKADLKKLNSTYLFLKDRKIDSLTRLSQVIKDNSDKMQEITSEINELKKKLDYCYQMQKYSSTYEELKPVFESYNASSGNSDRAKLILFEQAKAIINSSSMPASISEQIKDLSLQLEIKQSKLDEFKKEKYNLENARKNIQFILNNKEHSLSR